MKKLFASLAILAGIVPASFAQATEISFQHLWQESHELQYLFKEAIAKAEALSEGTLKITYYTLGEVTTPLKVNEGLKDGQVDMAVMVPAITPMALPYNASLTMPFVLQNNPMASASIQAIYAMSPEMQAEMAKDYHVFTMWGSGRSVIATKIKPVKTPADLKGQRIVVSGAMLAQDVTAWGGEPVVVPYKEDYTTVSSDKADGYYNTLFHAVASKIPDVAKEVTIITPSITPFVLAMNKTSWEKLTDKEKVALSTVFNKEFGAKVGELWYKMGDADIEKIQAAGAHVYELTQEEYQAFVDTTLPILEKFWAGLLQKANMEKPEEWMKGLYERAKKAVE